MTIPQKLQAIQRLSGLNQTKLAAKLGVTFVAFNRWMNDKAIPRKKAQERIDALYREYTGLTVIPEKELQAKKGIVLLKAKGAGNVLHTILVNPDIRDQFVLTLTYTSNSIEGSTLTEAETAVVLFQNVALPDKTLTEQLEAKNHQTALLYLFDHLHGRKAVDEHLLLKLHGMLMNGIRPDAGSYRHHGVRIIGADLPTANCLKVPSLMEELAQDFMISRGDIIADAADIHARFEKIHPFSDGNGRIGRLLLHAMLLEKNLPPAVIRPERKRLYYSFLNIAQKKDDTSILQDFFCDAILDGWDILNRK
ncbi:MAG: Fic family protein [Candidatus Peribacteraceae bacterium]|jgi:Fic family protein|nr:Fic family protein [Candidatus Peribacteraceae bacterium]